MNKCSVPLSKPTLPCSFLPCNLTMKRLCIRVYPRGLLTCDHDCPCAFNFCGITTQVCVEIWPLITCGRSSISRVHTCGPAPQVRSTSHFQKTHLGLSIHQNLTVFSQESCKSKFRFESPILLDWFILLPSETQTQSSWQHELNNHCEWFKCQKQI